MGRIWPDTCRKHIHHLSGNTHICTGHVRTRTGHFQLFVYHATGYVRHVVLHAYFYSDEWPVHTISSMPDWAQYITYINPLRYFMEMMRMVYLKGSGIGDIVQQLCVLSCFATILYSWAIHSYRKQQ